MKKIYLFCSAGMSTSMLASNMQSVANAHNLPIKVAAFSHNKLEEIIEKDTPYRYDACGFGPLPPGGRSAMARGRVEQRDVVSAKFHSP